MGSDEYRKMAILSLIEKVESSKELTPDAKETILRGLMLALYSDEPADGSSKGIGEHTKAVLRRLGTSRDQSR